MRCRNTEPRLTAQRDTKFAQPEKDDKEKCSHIEHNQSLTIPIAEARQTISTERIMQAVETQRRITLQLEDLHARQKQRALLLRRTGLILLGSILSLYGILILTLVILCMFQPDVLLRTMNLTGTLLTSLVAIEGSAHADLSVIPMNSWVLSGAALAIVLMMGLWLHLMRYPQEV